MMTTAPKKVSVVFGTRPEAIKLAPVIAQLRASPGIVCQVCVTAQHRQMLDQVLEVFKITPDRDLDLMRPDQSLADFTARALQALDAHFRAEPPDLVLVQGDTTTVLCAALAAFYNHVPVGHVEAGLRTGDMQQPWPEEMNRVLSSRLASLHFAPTELNRGNLLREGVPADTIHVTGNTVIDALLMAAKEVELHPPVIAGLAARPPDRQVVLITGHRRENFGEGVRSMCEAIGELADKFPGADFVYPVHLNPNVRGPVFALLGDRPNILLLEPQPYLAFVALLKRATLVLTDSGGLQEEAPSLGKPVLVMRDTTERPESIEAGTSALVGTDTRRIVDAVSELLTDKQAYERMSRAANPYGDGKAAERIAAACRGFLGLTTITSPNGKA